MGDMSKPDPVPSPDATNTPRGQATDADLNRADHLKSLPFTLLHVVALVTPFFVGITWGDVALCIFMYYLRMFGITAGYHRYFSHRAYKTGRIFQFLLAFLGTTAMQKGVLWWAAHHRKHHKYSDQPEDIHSPVQNTLYWAHVGWILSRRYDATDWARIQDFAKYPELRWLNKYYVLPPMFGGFLLYLYNGWAGFVWGGLVSSVLLWHGTFTINSLSHVWGSRRYKTTDDSRNNPVLAMITMGEGWHNNHHYYQSTANQGFFWWEVDLSYYILRALSVFGIVWDLRTPPKHILENVDKDRDKGGRGAGSVRPSTSGSDSSEPLDVALPPINVAN
jgi:stearoyl-CoA desaturase (delta-9 desaturase)